MSSQVQYSVCGPLEPEELSGLLKSVGMNAFTHNKLGKVIANTTAYVTARDAGKLIGFGRLLSDGATLAYINNMAVDPHYQGHGVGQVILEKLVESAGDVNSIFLYTNTADKFYLRHGFVRSEKRLYIKRFP